jgi:RNA recognition motif-containing protein
MKIFVGGLSRDATEEDVRNAFASHGAVTSVAVLKDKFTGEPRGFGFVEMDNKAEAEAAINALNGSDMMGRTLTVNEARPKTDRPRGGGGGGGGGWGDRPPRRDGGGGGGRGGRGGGGGGGGGGGWGRR